MIKDLSLGRIVLLLFPHVDVNVRVFVVALKNTEASFSVEFETLLNALSEESPILVEVTSTPDKLVCSLAMAASAFLELTEISTSMLFSAMFLQLLLIFLILFCP
jgi:hypothetical protein